MDFRGIAYSVGRVAADPRRLLHLHYSKVLALVHQTLEKDHFWILNRAFGIQRREFEHLERDLVDDVAFRTSIEARYLQVRQRPIEVFTRDGAGDANPGGRLLYYCVRLLRPERAIDTGVLDGFSTACILKGLHDNGLGHLHSIDLPAYEEVADSSNQMSLGRLPPGHEPGWVIPDYLRPRWTLNKGSSKDLLPPLLAELQQLDFFYHDSLHTFEHMLWEYRVAWPYLNDGGVLLSDDIFWNRAFWIFTQQVKSFRLIKRGVGLTRKGVAIQS